MGHVCQKTRLQGKSLEKPCVCSRGSKTRSVCHILEKPCALSRGHIFNPILMKHRQNVCLDEI